MLLITPYVRHTKRYEPTDWFSSDKGRDFMLEHNISIMNFTGAYEHEDFYGTEHFNWIDCRDVKGTYGYSDENALKILSERIAPYSPEGIHFIDSGNYHYVSKLWTDRIHTPFSLIVFDHHPDMQPSLFEGLMSCGCWVKHALDTNPYLKKVILIGVSDSLIANVENTYRDRLVIYSQSEMSHDEGWSRISESHLNEPVYISIDKDVLNESSAVTDWDQGTLSLEELKLLLSIIMEKEMVLGVDICGECPDTLRAYADWKSRKINNVTNRELMNLLVHEHDKMSVYQTLRQNGLHS